MAATTATPFLTGSHTSEKNPNVDHSPSGFTAVNGRESLPNSVHSNDDSPRTSDSTIKVGGDYRPSSRQPSPHPRHGGNRHELTNGDHKPRPQPPSHQPDRASPSAHKRKRSQSDDEYHSSSSDSRYARTPPTPVHPPTTQPIDARIYGSDAGPHHAPQEVDRNVHYPHSQTPSDSHMHPHSNPWQDRGATGPPPYHTNGNRLDASEAQLVEALQRENHGPDPPHRSWGVPSRSEGESGDNDPYAGYGQERTPQGSVQVGPKRKRVFSNRTKTGCLTCRRRKKKCDEQHPQCNNCIRGGFQCEGYNTRSTWQKPSNAKGPVPLQAKDGYSEAPDHGYRIDDNSPRQGRSSLNREGMGIRTRPIVVEDGEHLQPQFTASPTSAGPHSRGSYPGQPWPNPSNPPYLPEHPLKHDYRDLPPFSEVARGEPGKPEYGAMPPMREMPRPIQNTSQPPPPPAPPGPQWQTHPQIDYRPSYPPPHVDTSTPQNTARMALNIEQQQSARRISTGEETEKKKMLRGLEFKFTDPELMNERDKCRNALRNFNDAGRPGTGSSFSLLKDIISPPFSKDKTNGYLGPGTMVETPFRCHYGYNIKLLEDVYIGENCTIIDAYQVTIGSKTTIGPNVTILTAEPGHDQSYRKGALSTWRGKPVTIEGEVWIGAGAVICPGVTLMRGCTVEPGTVVKPYATVAPRQVVGPAPLAVHEV